MGKTHYPQISQQQQGSTTVLLLAIYVDPVLCWCSIQSPSITKIPTRVLLPMADAIPLNPSRVYLPATDLMMSTNSGCGDR